MQHRGRAKPLAVAVAAVVVVAAAVAAVRRRRDVGTGGSDASGAVASLIIGAMVCVRARTYCGWRAMRAAQLRLA